MSGLSVTGLIVNRGGQMVIDQVSHDFAAGRVTAVIGPNGSGKSSLLATIAGLLAPAAGVVRLSGVDLSDLSRRCLAERRAYLPQRAGVDWPISVERVVALGLLPQLPAFGELPETLRPAVEKMVIEFDLQDVRHRPVTELSGGELARVMLARAIVGDPEWLIVDEPTAGLDPRHAIDAASRLRSRADAGRTVIVALHDLDLALRFADEVVALKNGRLLAAGPAFEVMTEDGLAELYDVRTRVSCDSDGAVVRFLG